MVNSPYFIEIPTSVSCRYHVGIASVQELEKADVTAASEGFAIC